MFRVAILPLDHCWMKRTAAVRLRQCVRHGKCSVLTRRESVRYHRPASCHVLCKVDMPVHSAATFHARTQRPCRMRIALHQRSSSIEQQRGQTQESQCSPRRTQRGLRPQPKVAITLRCLGRDEHLSIDIHQPKQGASIRRVGEGLRSIVTGSSLMWPCLRLVTAERDGY